MQHVKDQRQLSSLDYPLTLQNQMMVKGRRRCRAARGRFPNRYDGSYSYRLFLVLYSLYRSIGVLCHPVPEASFRSLVAWDVYSVAFLVNIVHSKMLVVGDALPDLKIDEGEIGGHPLYRYDCG